MNWKNLFTPVKNITAGQAKAFMDDNKSAEYQLLDVRQPKEYERQHLPGAKLIPLREVSGRLDELEPDKPTIVYCAIGGRSKAAAQILSGKGFADVSNLAGGIKAWHDPKATGIESEGLELFKGDEEFADALSLAYAMEDGLQYFYQMLAQTAEDGEVKKLLTRLAGFEEKHKARLRDMAEKDGKNLQASEADEDRIMEGGRSVSEFLKSVRSHVKTAPDVFDLAMMLEAQALDLYSRMARKSEDPDSHELFLQLCDEEKMHLSLLADELDRLLS